jgi:hypothetical protein
MPPRKKRTRDEAEMSSAYPSPPPVQGKKRRTDIPPSLKPHTDTPHPQHRFGSYPATEARPSTPSTASSRSRGHSTARLQSPAASPPNLNTPGLLTHVNLAPHPRDDPKSSEYSYGPTRLPPVPYQGPSPFASTDEVASRSKTIPISSYDYVGCTPQYDEHSLMPKYSFPSLKGG